MIRARRLESAPKDGTMVRLLVQWPTRDENPNGPWGPFEDCNRSWTFGFNSEDHTGEDAWQFAGWDWQQDQFVDYLDRDEETQQAAGMQIIGWLPLDQASTDDPPAEDYDLDFYKQRAVKAVEDFRDAADINLSMFDAVGEADLGDSLARKLYDDAGHIRDLIRKL